MLFTRKKYKTNNDNVKDTSIEDTLATKNISFNPNIESSPQVSKVKDDNLEREIADALLDEVLQYFVENKSKSLMNIQRGTIRKEDVLEEVKKFLNGKNVSPPLSQKVMVNFEKYFWGYHILEDLINDPSISDIKILSKDNVRIKRFGKRMTSNVKFKSTDDLKRFISIVAIKNKANTSDINAIQKFTDKSSNKDFILRFNISTEYVNSVENPYLHIRKIPKQKYSKEKLIELGLATPEQIEYLCRKVKSGSSLIFTGKGGSGKTTLMNFLLDEIPHDKSGLVIQEAEELFSKTHPDLMFQKVKLSKGEGKIEYTLKDLSINGLLVDLDYFIIGEIKGDEALYFLNAAYTGHTVMSSVHGNNSVEAINKLVDYMKYASDYSRTDLLKMVKSLGTVVYMKGFKIQEISEIVGFNEKRQDLDYNMVFKGSDRVNHSIKHI